MKDKPKPKPEDIPADDPPTPEEIGKIIGRILNVPKAEIDRRVREQRKRKGR